MTPSQPPDGEPRNPLSPLGRRTPPTPKSQLPDPQARSPHGTWELPVVQPSYAAEPPTAGPADPEARSTLRLWAGGGATALVAAGVGVVGVLVVRGLLNMPILSAKGRLVNQAMVVVPLWAALAALAATALLHLLLLTTPRPAAFFGAICAIAIVVLEVFLAGGNREEQVATAILYGVIGVTVILLLSGIARTAVQPAVMRTQREPDYWHRQFFRLRSFAYV